jgi:hypothetical protein
MGKRTTISNVVLLAILSVFIGKNIYAREVPPIVLPEKEFTVFGAEVVNIDATNPTSTKVNYRTKPYNVALKSVTFVAPGTTQTKTNVSGDFYFIFNQNNLVEGDNLILLTVDAYLSVEIEATRLEIRGPQVEEVALARIAIQEGIVPVPVVHQLFEVYHLIDYSCPIVERSKTIWVGESHVNIKTQESELPTAIAIWTEKHFYRDNDGDHLEQFMSDVTYPTIPPQSDYFKSKDSFNDAFFKPNNNLNGIGRIESLVFESAAGLVFPLFTLNRAVDKDIE